jgi:hypothetical protein
MSKTKFLSAVNNIIHDMGLMIKHRALTYDEKKELGVRVFTSDCPICERKNKECPSSCMLAENLRCLDHKTFPNGNQRMQISRLKLRLQFWKEMRRVGSVLTEEAFDDLPLIREIWDGIDAAVYRRYYDD